MIKEEGDNNTSKQVSTAANQTAIQVVGVTPAAPGHAAAVYYTSPGDDPALGPSGSNYDNLPSDVKSLADQYAAAHGLDTSKLSSAGNTQVAPTTPTTYADPNKSISMGGRDVYLQTANQGLVDYTQFPIEEQYNAWRGVTNNPYRPAWTYDVESGKTSLSSMISTTQAPTTNSKPVYPTIKPLVTPENLGMTTPYANSIYNKNPLAPNPFAYKASTVPAPFFGVIPSYVVDDVIAMPGNMVNGAVGLGNEAQSVMMTDMNSGPVAAIGKAGADWWAWESDLGQSMKADPGRYFFNLGAGYVVGTGIGKIASGGIGYASNTVKNAGGVSNIVRIQTANDLLKGAGKMDPEYYNVPAKAKTPYTTTWDLSDASEQMRLRDIRNNNAYMKMAYEADKSRSVTITGDNGGSIKYTGIQALIDDDSGTLGRSRQILVAPETVSVAARTGEIAGLTGADTMVSGGLMAAANVSSLSRNINTQRSMAFPKLGLGFSQSISSPQLNDVTPAFKNNRMSGVTQMQKQTSGSGTPPVNIPGQSSGVGLASIIGAGVGLGALMYGSSKLLNMSGSGGGDSGGSFHRAIGLGMKRGRYKTGSLDSMLYGKKKRRAHR